MLSPEHIQWQGDDVNDDDDDDDHVDDGDDHVDDCDGWPFWPLMAGHFSTK